MIFHENRLPADDSHDKSCLILLFLKKKHNLKLSPAANYRWRFKAILIWTCGILGRFIYIPVIRFYKTIFGLSVSEHDSL